MWHGSSPNSAVSTAAGLVVVALIVAGLVVARDLLLPLVAAGFVSFLLQWPVRWLIDRGLGRSASVIVVILSTTLLLAGIATFMAREVSHLAAELPKYETNLREKARSASQQISGIGVWSNAADVLSRVESELRRPSVPPKEQVEVAVKGEDSRPLSVLLTYAKTSVSPIATLLLVFLFTVFILLQYQDIRDRVVRLIGGTEVGRSTQALNEAGTDLAKFFRLQATLNLCFGIAIGIVLWLIGIPNYALWGVLAAISRFVPYIGGVLAAAFPLLMAASVDPGWTKLIVTGGVILVSEFAIGNIVEPLLFGKRTRLSPFAVLLSVAFWTMVWGPVGLLLATPITLSLVVFGEHIPQLGLLRIALGNTPALTGEQRLYHLLLAGDVNQAIVEAKAKVEEGQFVEYVDTVALPALVIAARDSNTGILRPEQNDRLRQTTIEFVTECTEFVALAREARDEASEAAAGGKDAAVSVAPAVPKFEVLMLPGRGSFDQAASDLVAMALDDMPVHVTPLKTGGLLGVGSVAETAPHPRYVGLVSVGGVNGPQLSLIVRRIVRDLDDPHIGVLYSAGFGDALRTKQDIAAHGDVFQTAKDMRQDVAEARHQTIAKQVAEEFAGQQAVALPTVTVRAG